MVHFSELRHRLVKILLSFVITVIVVYVSSFWWMTPFITYITRAHVSLHAFFIHRNDPNIRDDYIFHRVLFHFTSHVLSIVGVYCAWFA